MYKCEQQNGSRAYFSRGHIFHIFVFFQKIKLEFFKFKEYNKKTEKFVFIHIHEH
jgi:hypothetical protein